MEFFLSIYLIMFTSWVWIITMRQRELKVEIDMYLKELEQYTKFDLDCGERETIMTYKKRIEYLNNKLISKQIKLKSIRFF